MKAMKGVQKYLDHMGIDRDRGHGLPLAIPNHQDVKRMCRRRYHISLRNSVGNEN